MVALRDGDPREREQWINGIINNGGSIADAMMAGLLMRMEGDVQQDKKYSDSTTLVGCRLMDCSRLMVFLSPPPPPPSSFFLSRLVGPIVPLSRRPLVPLRVNLQRHRCLLFVCALCRC